MYQNVSDSIFILNQKWKYSTIHVYLAVFSTLFIRFAVLKVLVILKYH